MAKRRTTKRYIHNICTELWAECIAVSLYGKTDEKNMEAMLHSILKVEKEYISRMSHCEPGLKAKVYFKDVKDKFIASVSDIVDQMNYLS
jgi:hypothetical protein